VRASGSPNLDQGSTTWCWQTWTCSKTKTCQMSDPRLHFKLQALISDHLVRTSKLPHCLCAIYKTVVLRMELLAHSIHRQGDIPLLGQTTQVDAHASCSHNLSQFAPVSKLQSRIPLSLAQTHHFRSCNPFPSFPLVSQKTVTRLTARLCLHHRTSWDAGLLATLDLNYIRTYLSK
jgi:hypothetical protein